MAEPEDWFFNAPELRFFLPENQQVAVFLYYLIFVTINQNLRGGLLSFVLFKPVHRVDFSLVFYKEFFAHQ